MRESQSSTRRLLCAVLLGGLLASLTMGPGVRAAAMELAQRRGLQSDFDSDSDAGRYLRMKPSERAAMRSGEVEEIHIATQFGLGYLPLIVARQYRLIEKRASAAGLGNLRVQWSRFPSGKAMNAAIKSGLLDFGSGGVAPLLAIWDATRGARHFRGVAALCSMPLFLNTVNPDLMTVRDFTTSDRIALPAAKVSLQAVVLQMAAAQVFGPDQYTRLDALTITMSHPEGMAALLAKPPVVTAHFTSPPYQYQELREPRVRKLMSSYDVLGGPTTFSAVWTRSQFYHDNPKTYRAVFEALLDAIRIIQERPEEAADAYALQSGSPMSSDNAVEIISDPSLVFAATPLNIEPLGRFMQTVGTISEAPADWREVFLPMPQEGTALDRRGSLLLENGK